MSRFIMLYHEGDRAQRWVAFPMPVEERRDGFEIFSAHIFGREHNLLSSSCPEDSGNTHYVCGGNTRADYNWYCSSRLNGQVTHLRVLYLWGKAQGKDLIFLRADDLDTNTIKAGDELDSLLEERGEVIPSLTCTCGTHTPVTEFVKVGGIVVCPACAGDIKVCGICGEPYNTAHCPSCYTMEPCAFCDENDNPNFNRNSIPLCAKHRDVTLVMEKSYSWKPTAYVYRHVASH